MTHLVSVVTAVHGPSMRFLPEAYESLAAQAMPDGWDWQWLIQEDGTSHGAEDLLPVDVRISFGTGRPFGPAVARTYALSRAIGELVKVLDSDDVLTGGTLAREIDVLTANPYLGWTTCQALDLLADGSTAGIPSDPDGGVLRRGDVAAYWRAHHHRAPVHPATLCIRTDLLLALGGWMALPAGEDTGLLLAADAVSDGYFIAEAGLYYRKWSGQATADPAHTAPDEWTARNAVIDDRARALGRLFPEGWPVGPPPTGC